MFSGRTRLVLAALAVGLGILALDARPGQAQVVVYRVWWPQPVRTAWRWAAATTYRMMGGRTYVVGYGPPSSYATYVPPTPSPLNSVSCTPIYGAAPEGTAAIAVSVPVGAHVTINGHATTTTGVGRRYYSRGLSPGATYKYEIEVTQTGDEQAESSAIEKKTVYLRSTELVNVDFTRADNPDDRVAHVDADNADASRTTVLRPVTTRLILHAPPEAEVFLNGAKMTLEGATREFETRRLAIGDQWEAYRITASLDKDGETVELEERITLTAGQRHEFTFDFDEMKVREQLPEPEDPFRPQVAPGDPDDGDVRRARDEDDTVL